MRNDSGLLIDRTGDLIKVDVKGDDAKQLLVDDIQRLAYSGQPFTIRGAQDGIVNRRNELSAELRAKPGRDTIIRYVKELIEEGTVKLCIHTGKTRFLDVPNGPFATGTGEIRRGGNE
ncbi:MAG: hypothetical protein GY771_08620 [bacterium]|nr:hypothetical protein [bacterium]